MKDSMDKLGLDAKIGSPADFAKFVAEEVPRWSEIVRSTGMKAE
jgi:tripartite-type tricarboxylate transporter receptor subunit TctC